MKKIAVMSDIHSMNFLFEKILKELEQENIEDYIFCGDYVTDGFDNDKVLEHIKNLTNNVIIGNRGKSILEYDGKSLDDYEQWRSLVYVYKTISDENKHYLSTLSEYKIIEIENKKICFSHGSPYYIRQLIYENDYETFDKLINDFNCDIYLFGHTHYPFVKKYKNRLFINTGSVSIPTNNIPKSTYGILVFDDDIKYIQKEYNYDFEEVKNYYINSDYYYACFEWCNILLHNLRTGICYCDKFSKYLNNKDVSYEIWKEKFKNFMKENDLEIY